MFRVTALDHLATTWVASGVTSVAVWAPPGHRVNRWREAIHGPGDLAVFRSRSLVGLPLQEAMRKVHPQEPHWYLYLLGSDPVHQGRSHGSAVLQPVLDRCDDDAMPAYLESSKEANIPCYRRHGFEVQKEFRPVDGGPPLRPMWPMWPMWREPR